MTRGEGGSKNPRKEVMTFLVSGSKFEAFCWSVSLSSNLYFWRVHVLNKKQQQRQRTITNKIQKKNARYIFIFLCQIQNIWNVIQIFLLKEIKIAMGFDCSTKNTKKFYLLCSRDQRRLTGPPGYWVPGYQMNTKDMCRQSRL